MKFYDNLRGLALYHFSSFYVESYKFPQKKYIFRVAKVFVNNYPFV